MSRSQGESGGGGGTEEARELEEDFYALLNVPRGANREEVKAQYMELAKVLHPDKRGLLRAANVSEADGRNSNRNRTRNRAGVEEGAGSAVDGVDNEAQELFMRVDAAYKTLMDDRCRKVYDEYGVAGLKALERLDKDGADEDSVGSYDRLGENIRVKILQRMRLEQAMADLEEFNINGMVQANVDATVPSSLSMTELHIQQAVTAPVSGISKGSSDDTIKLITSLIVARGELGLGNLILGYQHQLSDYTAVSTKFQTNMKRNGWSIKGNRTFSRRVDGSIEVLHEANRLGLLLKSTRVLSDTTSTVFHLGFGSRSGAGLQMVRRENYRPPPSLRNRMRMRRAFAEHIASGGDKDQFSFDMPMLGKREHIQHTIASIQLREGSGNVNIEWLNSLTSRSYIGAELMLGTDKIEVELKSIRQVAPQVKGGVSVALGLQGVSLKLFFTRRQFQYSLPIALSHTFSLTAAVAAGVIPACANYLIRRVLQPFQEIRDLKDKLREARLLNQARQTAKTQRRVIIGHAQRMRREEEETKGLVILIARYGHSVSIHAPFDWRDVEEPSDAELKKRTRARLPSDWDAVEDTAVDEPVHTGDQAESADEIYKEHPRNIDVTEQVQFFVKNSKLQLHAASKAKLLGFYNPLLGRSMGEPVLYVRYKVASWVYEQTFQDTDPIDLPDHRARLLGNTFTQSSVQWTE